MGLLSILFFAPAFAADKEIEEVVVKGNVLYVDSLDTIAALVIS